MGIGDRTHVAVLAGVLATADHLGKKPRTFHLVRGRGSEEGQVAGLARGSYAINGYFK